MNDRLLNRIELDTDIYEILIQRGDQPWHADSSLPSRRQTSASIDEALYATALDGLLRQAEALHIPENAITEAILEGRLSPRLDDLHLAFCGVHTYSAEDCLRPTEARSRLITKCVLDAAANLPRPPDSWMLETGLVARLPSGHQLGSNPDFFYFDRDARYALDKNKITLEVVELARKARLFYPNDSTLNQNERRRRWSERFGGLADIDSLETIYQNQQQTFLPSDLVALTAKRTRASGDQPEYADPYWIANPGVYDFLWFRQLPYGYPIDKDEPHPRHLDYYRVRNERYLPFLQALAERPIPQNDQIADAPAPRTPAATEVPKQAGLAFADRVRLWTLAWLNGFAWQRGEELLWAIKVRQVGPEAANAYHDDLVALAKLGLDEMPMQILVFSVLGYATSPLGVIAVLLAGQLLKSSKSVFATAFFAEAFEEFLCYFGELNTYGPEYVDLSYAFGFGFFAAFFAGGSACFLAGKKKRVVYLASGFEAAVVLTGGMFTWLMLIR